MSDLSNQITLVTGASRGAGRAIALELGEAGATVYVTARSRRGEGTTEDLPGTVDETAEAVTARGGHGIPVRCDHTVDADVDTLVDRIDTEQGRLDLLVNNVWGGYEHYDGGTFDVPFWQQPLRHWDGMFTAGLRAHLVTTRAAAPLMLPQRAGLIVSTVAWDRNLYLGNLFYDVVKHAIVRMIYGMAQELREYNIAAVAVAPGFMRTERVMAGYAENPFDLSRTETPAYVGRAIVALASDPQVMTRSGQIFRVGDLAPEYGFTDVDGRQVPPFEIDQA